MYAGASGIICFLLGLYDAAKDESYLEEAEEAAKYIIYRWHHDRSLKRNFSQYAFSSGWSGAGFASVSYTHLILTDTGNDYISFEVRNIQPIAVTKKYAGITASLMAKIKNTKTPINIDFGVGDVIIPRQEKRAIPTQLAEFEKPVVNTYSLETTIAEKIDAILDLMEYSSRMKDYYDIYYLSKHFEFDSEILSEAMRKTFANRNHSFSKEQFDQVMQFGTNPEMKKKWHFFARKININDIDFEEVMREIKEFLEESFIKSC